MCKTFFKKPFVSSSLVVVVERHAAIHRYTATLKFWISPLFPKGSCLFYSAGEAGKKTRHQKKQKFADIGIVSLVLWKV